MSIRVLLAGVITILSFSIGAFAGEETTVYYFHTNKRCTKCRNLEAYAKEAVNKYFSKELTEGTLQWKVINIENAGNKHFVTEYSLITSSVVLVKSVDGREEKWKNLDKIWRLVSNKEKYIQYIRESIESF